MSSWSLVASVRSRVELHRTVPGGSTTTESAIARTARASAPSAPWLALCPPATVLRDPTPYRARGGEPGSQVVLASDRPFGRRRLRRTARLAGLVVERELLVLPGTRQPLVAV